MVSGWDIFFYTAELFVYTQPLLDPFPHGAPDSSLITTAKSEALKVNMQQGFQCFGIFDAK